MPTTMTLPPKFSMRLEKLALDAGCPPEKMLDCVMRDGFEYTERFVREVNKGIAEADAGADQLIPHEEAMSRLKTSIEKHAKKQKAA